MCDWLIRLTIVAGAVGVCLLIAGAVAWFRWQFSLRTLMLLVTAFAILCSLLATLNRHPKRYLNEVRWCRFSREQLLLYNTYWEEEFLYGFVTERRQRYRDGQSPGYPGAGGRPLVAERAGRPLVQGQRKIRRPCGIPGVRHPRRWQHRSPSP